MEAACFSELSVSISKAIWFHRLEDHNLNFYVYL
jgi:hypothetical protein